MNQSLPNCYEYVMRKLTILHLYIIYTKLIYSLQTQPISN